MTPSPESQFLQALELCQSLSDRKAQFSSIPCLVIELLCDIAQAPDILSSLLLKYSREVEIALVAIDIYAKSADNWRVKDRDRTCSLGFGVKDHCTILSCLLNFSKRPFSFTSYTGNFESEAVIFELLKDWKNLDIAPVFAEKMPDCIQEAKIA
jgi:hypothetical protein